MQYLSSGPTPTGPGPTVPDDQFGGAQPEIAHLSGVILRLNPDGSPPADNPFFIAGAGIGGEAGANLQNVFAYGLRNSFGIDFDPVRWTPTNIASTPEEAMSRLFMLPGAHCCRSS